MWDLSSVCPLSWASAQCGISPWVNIRSHGEALFLSFPVKDDIAQLDGLLVKGSRKYFVKRAVLISCDWSSQSYGIVPIPASLARAVMWVCLNFALQAYLYQLLWNYVNILESKLNCTNTHGQLKYRGMCTARENTYKLCWYLWRNISSICPALTTLTKPMSFETNSWKLMEHHSVQARTRFNIRPFPWYIFLDWKRTALPLSPYTFSLRWCGHGSSWESWVELLASIKKGVGEGGCTEKSVHNGHASIEGLSNWKDWADSRWVVKMLNKD